MNLCYVVFDKFEVIYHKFEVGLLLRLRKRLYGELELNDLGKNERKLVALKVMQD